MAFRRSPTSPFLLGRHPPAPCPKSPEEVGGLGQTISGTSEEAQVDGRSIAPRANCIVTTIVTGSSSRLAYQYLGGFLQLFHELWLLLGKVNNETSGYKHLPSALTKCLLQVHV